MPCRRQNFFIPEVQQAGDLQVSSAMIGMTVKKLLHLPEPKFLSLLSKRKNRGISNRVQSLVSNWWHGVAGLLPEGLVGILGARVMACVLFTTPVAQRQAETAPLMCANTEVSAHGWSHYHP